VSENRWFPYTSDRWRNQPKSAVHFCTNNHVGMAGCTETWSTRFSDTLMLQIWAFRYFWPYGPRVRWLKIKNPDYSQNEGRHELFDRSAGARRSKARVPSPRPV
jgi:hypothetical protein